MGIIDTLTAGFNMVIRRPWLLIVPLLLDLVLLAGPKVTVLPLLGGLDALVAEAEALSAEQGLAPADVSALTMQVEAVRAMASEYNLAALVAPNRVLLPSVAGLRAIQPEADEVVEVVSPGRATLLVALFLAVGLFVQCAYWTVLAQETRGRRETLGHLLRAVPVFWLRTVGVAAVVVAFVLGLSGVGLVVMLGAQFLAALGAAGLAQAAIGLYTLAMWLVGVWLFFYLFFVPQALTLAEAGPLLAIRQSIVVVRTALWRSLGLVILVHLISVGLGLLWGALLRTTAGTVVAVLGNAFVGTGLAAAVFIYFRDRIIALHQAYQQQRPA